MKRLIIAAVVGLIAVAVIASLHVSVSTPVTFAGPITPTGWRPPLCGSGSGIAATGSGLLYQCAAVSSGSGSTNTIPKWTNSSGALGSSSISDNGTAVSVSEGLFVGSGNAYAEDLSSNGAPSGACGSGSIDRNYASNGATYVCVAGSWYIAAGLSSPSNHSLLRAGATAGTVLNANVTDDNTSFKIPEHVVVSGGTPSISCTSGTASCLGGVTCSDAAGVYVLTSATGCTLTFGTAYDSTPACEFTLGSSSAVGWVAIQTQSASSVKFSPENSSGFGTVSASVDYHCFGTN